MKQKFFALLLCLLLICSFSTNAEASAYSGQIIDNANLLTEQEQAELEAKANSIQETYGMDVVIVTIDSLDGTSAQNYADDFYDYNQYADDGILFLLAIEEREWYISTCGDAIYAVTDYGIQQLGDVARPYLSDGDYYEAFDAYLEELPYYFDGFFRDDPIDGYADYSGDYYHGDRETIVYYNRNSFGVHSIFLSVVIGLIAALITILVMRASMNTRRRQRSAGDYLKPGSYHLRTRHDTFLYSNVSKVRRQQNSSGGRGGGSSVHRSSSGRSHGGGGGRF